MDKRTPRTSETREETSRKRSWAPASLLPTPDQKDGWQFRWIRTSSRGNVDNTNVSSKFRQGWEPVMAEEHPEIKVLSDRNSQFKDNIEVGGLLLCKAPVEMVDERNAYYRELAENQLASVESSLMRESDRRMPLNRPQIDTKITFGGGRTK